MSECWDFDKAERRCDDVKKWRRLGLVFILGRSELILSREARSFFFFWQKTVDIETDPCQETQTSLTKTR